MIGRRTVGGGMLEIGASAQTIIRARPRWNRTGVPLIAGYEYELRATGGWRDWRTQTDADGYASRTLLLRLTERLRRAPRERWFALIGAIDAEPKTQFHIGAFGRIMARSTGELTCFANDVNFMYWNNHGALQLTVKRVR